MRSPLTNGADLRNTGTEGSFTVEMALIFPSVLILLVCVIEIGLWYRVRIVTDTGIQETLLLVESFRSQGHPLEEATILADGWLEDLMGEIGDFSHDWEIQDSYLKEAAVLRIWGSYGSILPLSYQDSQRICHPDPRRFRDRVDLICEKLSEKE